MRLLQLEVPGECGILARDLAGYERGNIFAKPEDNPVQ